MKTLRFSSVMKIRGINPYVPVSKEQAAALKPDWRKPMPVLVRINGQPKEAWPINMMPDGDGGFYLYLHGSVREASKTKVGDTVDVEVRFDAAYKNGPMHPMPDWFRVPLEKDTKALRGWEMLIPSRQKEILRYLAGLKSASARERNVTKALHVLSGSEARFMARSWQGGS